MQVMVISGIIKKVRILSCKENLVEMPEHSVGIPNEAPKEILGAWRESEHRIPAGFIMHALPISDRSGQPGTRARIHTIFDKTKKGHLFR